MAGQSYKISNSIMSHSKKQIGKAAGSRHQTQHFFGPCWFLAHGIILCPWPHLPQIINHTAAVSATPIGTHRNGYWVIPQFYHGEFKEHQVLGVQWGWVRLAWALQPACTVGAASVSPGGRGAPVGPRLHGLGPLARPWELVFFRVNNGVVDCRPLST